MKWDFSFGSIILAETKVEKNTYHIASIISNFESSKKNNFQKLPADINISYNDLVKKHLAELSKLFLYISEKSKYFCSSADKPSSFGKLFIMIFSDLALEILSMPSGKEFLMSLQKKEDHFTESLNQERKICLSISYNRTKQMLEWKKDKNFIIFCLELGIPELSDLLQNISEENLSEKAKKARDWMSNQKNHSFLMEIKQFYPLHSKFTEMPPEIGRLTNLEKLALWGNTITFLPPEIGQLTNLKELYLSENKLISLPPEIGNLISLQWLFLNSNKLRSLSQEIRQLTALRTLNLENNQLTDFPPEIVSLTYLQRLNLRNNKISSISPEISKLTELVELHLEKNPLTFLPQEIDHLPHLRSNLLPDLPRQLPPSSGLLSCFNSSKVKRWISPFRN